MKRIWLPILRIFPNSACADASPLCCLIVLGQGEEMSSREVRQSRASDNHAEPAIGYFSAQ